MRKIFQLSGFLLLMFSLNSLACNREEREDPSQTKDGGVIGSRCNVVPVLLDPNNLNVCQTPKSTYPGKDDGEFFFPGLSMLVAEDLTIKYCIEANGLDYGYLAGPGKSCAEECKRVVNCLPFSND